jgi:hypothetical protein
MDNNTDEDIKSHEGESCAVHGNKKCYKKPAYQAYQILHIGFALLPIIVGLDKFFNFFTIWEHYLAGPFDVFHNPMTTMMVVGAIEILVGLGVWFKPRIFAYVVALWLLAIIINLLMLHGFYDVALRDFALMLGALALGRLSAKYDNCNCCCNKHPS